MGCCLALAYLASLVRRACRSVLPGSLEVVGFAPPARRPAPGASYAVPPPVRSARPKPSWRPVARGLVVAGLSWFALGVVGMHLLGWFAWASASLVTDTVFHSSGLWLSATGAALLIAKA